MIASNRLGTTLLGLSGLALVGLMAYTLAAGPRAGRPLDPDRGADAEVVVFLPNPADWADFRAALEACRARGAVRGAGPSADANSVEVASPERGRRIRFRRQAVKGVGATSEDARDLAKTEPTPVAFVGSTTTVLTVALAESLRARGAGGPNLLVPWATALAVPRPGHFGPIATPLTEIDPDRTFRFCPNNRTLADAVVDCLIAQDGGRLPSRAFLVVDPFDPYSEDLAACFRQAIRARKPDIEIVERADAVDLPTLARPSTSSPEPSSAEVSLAGAIASAAEAEPPGRSVWAVLPLQDQPAHRMISALRRRLAGRPPVGSGNGSLLVACGDGLEKQTLDDLARSPDLPIIWTASTSWTPGGNLGVTDDTQALAEIVSATAWAVDHARSDRPGPDEVNAQLRRIDLAAESPAAFGRRLAFDASGERSGHPERVLVVRPDAPRPIPYARTASGAWEPSPGAGP